MLPTSTNRDLAAANLAAVWANYRDAGARRLILARVVQHPDDIAFFTAAIPGCELRVCTISADPSVIDERLTRREPGLARTFLRRVATELAPAIAGLRVDNAIEVRNHAGTSITSLAQHVLTELGWPLPDETKV